MSDIILKVENLKKYFPVSMGIGAAVKNMFSSKQEFVHAVDGLSFKVKRGDTISLVGETGSGKTTCARLVLRLIEVTSGTIEFDGVDIVKLKKNQLRKARKDMQMIFQDPFASLNPRMKVEEIVGMPLRLQGLARGRERRQTSIDLLDKVGLQPGYTFIDRFPHEFSGGQRQRIGVARAIASNPKFLVADEPVSSLDVSIRTQILNLIQDLKKELGLTMMLISHDLSVVRYLSDQIIVLYLGQIMEMGPSEEFYENPSHPYAKALLEAVPIPDPNIKRKRIHLKGETPSPINIPKGCRFHTRCPNFDAKIGCDTEVPELNKVGNCSVRCHLYK